MNAAAEPMNNMYGVINDITIHIIHRHQFHAIKNCMVRGIRCGQWPTMAD